MRDRPHRSDHYQQLYHEISFDVKWLDLFTNSQSMNNMLNPYEYSEDLFNLQDQLKKEFWELAQKILTARQWEVLNLVCEGHTQTEIAKMLGVNQSSIVKTIQGNCDYVHGAKRYGGLIKKMKTAIAKDPKFQEIFTQIQELKEEKL